MTLPAAVLWDMDGTLVDTEPYWMECEAALVEAHGGTWTQADAVALVGCDLLDSGAYIARAIDDRMTPHEVVDHLLDGVVERVEQRVPWRPGALELLGALAEAGVPQALVTMSWKRFAAPVIAQLPFDAFEVVVTGDVVGQGKPHPEAYLTAAARLGVEPAACVAIEDSPPGAASAEAAGCVVLGVAAHVAVPPGPRRVLRDTLVGLTPADLGGLRDLVPG